MYCSFPLNFHSIIAQNIWTEEAWYCNSLPHICLSLSEFTVTFFYFCPIKIWTSPVSVHPIMIMKASQLLFFIIVKSLLISSLYHNNLMVIFPMIFPPRICQAGTDHGHWVLSPDWFLYSYTCQSFFCTVHTNFPVW